MRRGRQAVRQELFDEIRALFEGGSSVREIARKLGLMRHLALRFRGLLCGGTTERLDAWLIDARASGIYAMQRFARTIRQDLEAARNAVLEPWSNGQTKGQINKLKTLKRAMHGRAGVDLLRARMMSLQEESLHQE